jgi:creatinine amidohydrolase
MMPHDEVMLERMTWPEVRAAIDAGRTTAVFACGAIEQHGPHLPLLVDAAHGSALAERVARAMGNTLAAPTVRVGCSEHHMAFPGTISFSTATLEAVCRDYCTSLARHGFRRICIIPAHGGNFAPISAMLPRLVEATAAVAPDARVVAYLDLRAVIGVWTSVAEQLAGLGDRVGGHADVAESSIMLALEPGLVRREAAAPGLVEPLTPSLMDRVFSEGFRSVTPNGILGDARGMSAAIGERCIDELAAILAEHFRAS